MAKKYSEITTEIEVIQNETLPRANTADRVGKSLKSLKDKIQENDNVMVLDPIYTSGVLDKSLTRLQVTENRHVGLELRYEDCREVYKGADIDNVSWALSSNWKTLIDKDYVDNQISDVYDDTSKHTLIPIYATISKAFVKSSTRLGLISDYRREGCMITYTYKEINDESHPFITVVEVYKSMDVSDSAWTNDSNWKVLIDKDQLDLKSNQTDLTDVVNKNECYNVTNRIPLPVGQYYDLTSAIAAIPVANRKLGLKLTYMSALYEKDTLTVTTAPTTSGNIVITLNGAAVTITLDSTTDTTPTLVATKIKATTFTGWTISGTGATVIFTKNVIGACSAPIFDAGATGSVASFVRTVVGAAESIIETQFNGSSIASWTTQTNWRRTANEVDIANLGADLNKKIDGVSTNLFNKNTIISGYFLNSANGLPTELNATWFTSDFIPVVGGNIYSFTSVSFPCYYDTTKKFLGVATISNNTVTLPATAVYLRFSRTLTQLSTLMMNEGSTLLAYVDYGVSLGIDSFTDILVNQLKNKMEIKESTIDERYLLHIREHLSNPFIKTQIKLLGDSITAGIGGTGFSETGESIPGEATKANVTTSICWSNMLLHYINDAYNKDVRVSVKNDNIKITDCTVSDAQYVLNSITHYSNQTVCNNTFTTEFISFTFYGSRFKVIYRSNSALGIFAVYVDNLFVQNVDCYSTIDNFETYTEINGLSEGTHTVSLRQTNAKNDLSSNKQIRIMGIVVPKTAIVKPWGIGGALSMIAGSTTGLLSSDDDFVIIQLGTNDRGVYPSIDRTYTNLTLGGEHIINDYGAKPIFMCANPTSEYYDSSGTDTPVRYFHMWDVHDCIARVANYFGVPFIDNYIAFQDYAEQHNINTDALTREGLHPNDLGYKVMFMNIMKSLGLARLPYWKEWVG